MKSNYFTIKVVAITFLALFIAGEVSAGYGWNYNSRSCKSWRKKYKARTHIRFITGVIPLCYRINKGCSSASSSCSIAGIECRASVEAWARNESGGGSINSCFPYACGETSDFTQNYFSKKYFSQAEYIKPDVLPAQQATFLKHNWEEGLLTISDMTFDLSSSVNDELINTFEFTFWVPNHTDEVEDTEIDADEILYSTTVELYKGKLSVEGDIFTEKDFSVTVNNGIATVQYIGRSIELEIPEEYKDVDKALSFVGDITINEEVEFEKAIDSENNALLKSELALEIFPNPTVETLNVAFRTNDEENPSISIYSIDGKLMKTFSKDIVVKNSVAQMILNVNDYHPGTYFILLQVGEEKIIEKFIKQ